MPIYTYSGLPFKVLILILFYLLLHLFCEHFHYGIHTFYLASSQCVAKQTFCFSPSFCISNFISFHALPFIAFVIICVLISCRPPGAIALPAHRAGKQAATAARIPRHKSFCHGHLGQGGSADQGGNSPAPAPCQSRKGHGASAAGGDSLQD